MKCPVCGSENVVILSDQNQKGYSFCNGLLGYICCGGPIGLLCGLFGMGETKSVSHTIYCQSCQSRTVIR